MLHLLYSNPRLHRLFLAGAPRLTYEDIGTADLVPSLSLPAEPASRLGTVLLLFGPPVCVYLGIFLMGSLALGGALGLFLAALLVRLNTRMYMHQRAAELKAQVQAHWPRETAVANAHQRAEIGKASSSESWLELAIYSGLPLGLLLQAIVMASQIFPVRAATAFAAILAPFALLTFLGSTLSIAVLAIKVSRFHKKIASGSL